MGESKVLVHNCKIPHANSKLSPKKQIVYGLKNEDTGLIEKVGISSGKVDKNGKPYRANKQKNEQNGKGGNYSVKILDEVEAGPGARAKALKLEEVHTDANAGSINVRLHKKPKPNPKSN